MRINDDLCKKNMGDNFKKIKTKYKRLALIASAVLGVCCGVVLACVLAVVFKTCAVKFHWALYIPVALAGAAGFAALFYFILRPTDKKLAKKLDADYSLGQKAQTMVEFSSGSGAMIEMQRAQTEEALGEVAKKRADFGGLLKFLFVPVLAVAMLFVGIFLPAKKTTGPVDPPYDITDAQETALKALIADVESSELESLIKTPTVEVLNDLLDGLRQTEQQSVMKLAVISAVSVIDNLIAAANTYLDVYTVFIADESLSPVAVMMLDCVIGYKTDGTKISTFAAVKAKRKAADEAVDGETAAWLESFMEGFTEDGQPMATASAKAEAQRYSAALVNALSSERFGESGDALVVSLKNLANSLGALPVSGISAQNFYNSVKGVASAFTEECAPALVGQSYNCMMDEYIRNSLAKIFGLTSEEIGDNQIVVPESTDGGDDDDGVHDGGYGGGEIKYGSDDMVLDADTGELVAYGQLLDKFNAAVADRIADGACDEETAKYIRQYFQFLYRGMETEDGNG